MTLPLLFCSLFFFQSGLDRKDIRSSRRCGNVCKRPCLRSYGKRCLRAVGKPMAFPSGRECLFSIGGAAVFHISIVLRVSIFDKGLGLSQRAIFVFRGRGPPKPKIRQWVLTGCACYNNPSLVFPSTNTTLPTGKNGKLSIFIDSVLHWPLRYQIILHHLVEIHFIFY